MVASPLVIKALQTFNGGGSSAGGEGGSGGGGRLLGDVVGASVEGGLGTNNGGGGLGNVEMGWRSPVRHAKKTDTAKHRFKDSVESSSAFGVAAGSVEASVSTVERGVGARRRVIVV